MPDRCPLVLLHPYPADAGFWDRLRAELGPNVPVIAPDAPGFGDAEPRPDWTIADLADDVARMIAVATPDGTADVLGLSMGGYVALALAARHPGRCRTLVLADTRADADDDAARSGRAAGIAAIRDGHTDTYLNALLPRLLAPDASADVRTALERIARRQSPDALVGALTALAGRPDRHADLAGIRVPTLVVVGSEDVVTPPAAAAALAAGIPGAVLAEIPGAGHLTALERPEAVAALVRKLRDRTDPAPG